MAAAEIRELLRPLISEARETKQWLWCSYQDIWFSPDELDAHHDNGKFLWGPVNWKLRDPTTHLRELEQRIKGAEQALSAFQHRISEAAA